MHHELDRATTDFVASVSHELRTPLTSIVGYVEILADEDAGPLNPEQRRLLAAVERNGQRLLALIDDLLVLSRIEAGTLRLARAPFDLAALVASARQAVLPGLAGRALAIEVDVPEALGPLEGDAGQLERVLLNLLSNAMKFSPEGSAITVRAWREGGQVHVAVADEGIGIPFEEQSRLFERFFRSSLARERSIQGTGLGLAISKGIVERHGGTIAVDSKPGKGSTFTITLPLGAPR
jgi:two-component system, OmpR family, phosphate regulon sensor histidine kinase PhoR